MERNFTPPFILGKLFQIGGEKVIGVKEQKIRDKNVIFINLVVPYLRDLKKQRFSFFL